MRRYRDAVILRLILRRRILRRVVEVLHARGRVGEVGRIGVERRLDHLDRGRAVVELYVVFEPADLGRAGRNDLVLRRQGVGHVLRRQPLRLKRLRVQVDLYLPLLAAVGRGDGRAWHGGQGGTVAERENLEHPAVAGRRVRRGRVLKRVAAV